jgi:large subunit ribosomal protein L35
MGKTKTHKASRKRFKVTANGKIKFRSPNRGHILGKKSGSRKRDLRNDGVITGTFAKKIAAAMGE